MRQSRIAHNWFYAIADALGFFISAHIERALHQAKLVEATIGNVFTPYESNKIVGDKAYGSNGLDQSLPDEGNVVMITPPLQT